MKKIIVSLILVIVTIFNLASCSIDLGKVLGNLGSGNSAGNNNNTGENNDGNGENNDGNDENNGNDENGNDVSGGSSDPNAIYGEGINTAIVTPKDEDINTLSIWNALFISTGTIADLKTDAVEKVGAEIVVGDTTRQISVAIKNKLEEKIQKKIRESDDEALAKKETVGFAIYRTGNSIAIVWSNEEIGDHAIEYFNTEFLDNGDLSLTEGYTYTNVFSITAYRKEKEAVMKEAAWDKLKKDLISAGATEASAEMSVEATKKHFLMLNEKIYLWFANLYDPTTGGFYYSNSARDTYGYLPDIESTFQVLTYLSGSGMFDEFGGTADERMDNLPQHLKDNIVNFLLTRQSPVDGYFYHPQWKHVETSRISRDLSWATELLKWFDVQPLYNTPNGMSGSLGAPTGTVPSSYIHTYKLNSSTSITAASKVIAANSVYPPHLQTLDAFNAYLDGFNMQTQSYYYGNLIASQTSQIWARGEEYKQAFKVHFDAAQRSDNGLWETKITYDSVNGLLKMAAAYNSLGLEFNYVEQAFESAFQIAKLENADSVGKAPNHAVDSYNPYYAIKVLFDNMVKFNKANLVYKLRSKIVENAPELIKAATAKTIKFQMPDGSFAYNWYGSNPTSQGAPAAVPGTREGDVNGNNIASTGIIGNLFATMGLTLPRIYYHSDYIRFIEEIESVIPVVKNPPGGQGSNTPASEDHDGIFTFDNEKLGVPEIGGLITDPNSDEVGNDIEIVDDPTSDVVGDNALFISVTQGNDWNTVYFNGSKLNPDNTDCYIFETDIYIAKGFHDTALQIFFKDEKGGTIVYLTIYYKTDQGKYFEIWANSGAGPVILPFNGMFNLRLELYTDLEIIKVYNDEECVGQLTGIPAGTPSNMMFATLMGSTFDIYLDNVKVYGEKKSYVAP